MCRKRTLCEVAGERIVCDENFACLTILAPALSDRTISGGKHMIFQHINIIHLARLDLNEPVCILIPKVVVIADNISKFGDVPKDYSRDTYLSCRARVRRHSSSRPFYSGRRLSHFQYTCTGCPIIYDTVTKCNNFTHLRQIVFIYVLNCS